MAIVTINDQNLKNIAAAIRDKNGSEDTYKPSEMAEAITAIEAGGGADIPEEAYLITGNCQYTFASNNWNWFIQNYKNKITTDNISSAKFMFYNNKTLEEIPFDMNFTGNKEINTIENLFYGCETLKSIGKISNLQPDKLTKMFSECKNLRYMPEFDNLIDNSGTTALYSTEAFYDCYSLRELPKDLMDWIDRQKMSTSSGFARDLRNLYCLDEIVGLPTYQGQTITSNTAFYYYSSSGFSSAHRLKNFTFRMNDDGTPRVCDWKTQILDFTSSIGHCPSVFKSNILNYNSGITADKEVTDDTTYQALKNDPDWFTCDIAYSRYNAESAAATINSLPDTSAYLATAGGTNTIKFQGAAGSATDGGAINTLNEETIALAAAKGWTVTFV